MRNNPARNFFFVCMILFLIAGCASPQQATSAPTETLPVIEASATSAPTATATPVPPSPTPIPPKTTNITIDGNADDWADYPANLSDPTGDQAAGMADLIEARYFMNDKYLYLLIRQENIEAWDDMAFVMGLAGGKGGQLNIRPNQHVNFGVFGEASRDLIVSMALNEVIEVKIGLDQFPAEVKRIDIISVFNHKQSGDDPVDDSLNGKMQLLKLVTELEPALPPWAESKPDATRVEFAAEDGHALVGYFYPAWQEDAPVIVLIHQYGITQEKWLEYGMVDWLQNWTSHGAVSGLFPAMPDDQSFAVFTLDLRGFGESGPAIPDDLTDEQFNEWGAGWVMDVKAALAYVKSLPGVDPARIALIGANNGADAAIAACGDCLGVLALSAGSYAGLDTKTNAEQLDVEGRAVWCFSTEKSAGSDVATCGSISGTQYKWINFPGDGRGMQLIREDKAPPEIGKNILDFLEAVFAFVP